ncbi:alpha/beta hydrolase [Streptomyces sp. NBC_01298]|uniref:alpha/beta hydrolase n=1 Tax=Streptomyces sp. NBC_01298 TaxID=2903817 RepID=UPI002E1223B3|nr:alpha/beta hydrolase [Streptomyces sp. NBC_01298]
MTTTTLHPDHADHFAPEGLLTRGTVIVVPGRGETPATYARFGRRLAADAYRVRVVDLPRSGDEAEAGSAASLDAFAARLEEAVEGTSGPDGVARPLVVVGSDAGAAAVAALLAREQDDPVRPDGVVLAGLPGTAAGAVETWDEELDARTSCPTHRGVLTNDAEVRRGSLSDPVPDAVLDAAYESASGVPALLLVGDADPLADREGLARTAKSLPRARLSVVRGAHHDVLNDLQHRSVAAEVVAFLETLRDGLVPLITVESSAW